jgi:hypothetical protein
VRSSKPPSLASDADKKQVAKIVNTAILEAPSQIRIIAQCAIATAPDAVSNIQAVVEKYDAAGGEGYSEKGGLEKGVIEGPTPLMTVQSRSTILLRVSTTQSSSESRWLPEFFVPTHRGRSQRDRSR